MFQRSASNFALSIRLKRQSHSGSFLIVEGNDDRHFFENFVDANHCKITVASGKDYVIEVITILESEGFSGILGIVDADLDHIVGYRTSSENIVILETVDLEALLIRSPALDRVLLEFGSPEKIEKLENDVRDILVNAAVWIGCLRLYSLRQNLNFKFKGIKYNKFIDRKFLSIRIQELVQQVLNHSRRNDLPADQIVVALNSVQKLLDNHWYVCHGKDMIEILSLGLSSTIGSKKSNDVRPEMIKKYLRMSFHQSDLDQSKLKQDIRKWESLNSDFIVLQ